MLQKLCLLFVAMPLCSILSSPASAEPPDRAIKMIVPFPAGGNTDNIFRALAPLLQKQLGQPVVISNVAGASGTVGAREARDSAADGYTIYALPDYIHLVYYAGLTDVSYKDFEPICLVAATSSVLAASAKTPWNNWHEFVVDAKKRPGEITVGAAMGTNSQIFPATIEKKAGIKFRYVPFEGSAPRWTAILAGQVDITDSNPTQKGEVDAGRLKFLAIASEKRDPDISNVPTLRELGLDVINQVARGLVVPKGTPTPIRVRLVDACAKATSEPAFAKALTPLGTRLTFLDDHKYAAFLDKTDSEHKAIMTDLGLNKRSDP